MIIPDKPTEPCVMCGTDSWYWPDDNYMGKKEWVCGKCHPKLEGK